jgi:GGDEF domain-containing protein
VNRESLLRQAMTLVRPRLRQAEFLAKFGLDDIAIALPRTGLAAARELAADLLELLSDQGYPACAALAEAAAHDRPRRLVSRADAALYTARLAGPGAVFQHSGFAIEPVADTTPEAPARQAVSSAQER